jgi:hypothetical protein
MVEPDAVIVVQAPAIGGAHMAFLAADGDFAALQPVGLAGVELAGANTLANALLLVFAALVDGCGVALHGRGCGLGKANSRSQCEKSNA